ncbi:MAG: phosphatase PAP2 family protein [Prevotella sp.]|nr:phosphatase PAP2 family protein [Prevotella sp.]
MWHIGSALAHPYDMFWGRMRMLAVIIGMWAVYRLVPCRFTMALRVFIQLAMLGWWYPDTYELNRSLNNLDHLFAQAEQWIFGCQPSLEFSARMPWPVLSELLDVGYVSYYPMMVAVMLLFFFYRYEEFARCSFVVLTSFFLYYVIFDLLPVAGPTFYFQAIGLENAMQGHFPAIGNYFDTHRECMQLPGFSDGIGYWMVEIAHLAGERPTAAFPSSHVGVATVCMLLSVHGRARKLFTVLLPFYVLLCFATVYIQAHYAVDAIAGLITGTLFYFLLMWVSRRETTV